MSNYIEYNDKIAFHPGYYIKEIVDDSGLTQEDFAKRLGTTPKNLSILVRGEQSLSIDMAAKLSRLLGTTTAYWLHMQQAYDEKVADFLSQEELKKEKEVFKMIDYKYFCNNFDFPVLSRKVDEQIERVRAFLSVSSLTVLEERNLAVNYRSYKENLSRSNIINANVMTQIAINKALKTDAPKYNKKRFEKAVDYAVTQTRNHEGFFPEVKKAFEDAGVVLVVLPNLKNSGVNGATKKVDGKVMVMVNARRHYADTFWFTLFHEVGHVLNGDMGITYKDDEEDEADLFAQRILIPEEKYRAFTDDKEKYNESDIREFAESINQDPGIVLGRLMLDGKIPYTETYLSKKLRHNYSIIVA
ncbi:MAG: HigA family addiction module antidote protein [Eubacterium sp.]|nr:HigA family addiction module antidote protein [Eubacterium sp.]